MNKKYTTNIILCSKSFLSNYINYELSSFAKEGYFSKTIFIIFWKKYIGIGPSAHSFDGTRSEYFNNFNMLNIVNTVFYQNEHLSKIDQYNEYVMTGLRIIWGICLIN